MGRSESETTNRTFEPRWPTAIATGVLSVWVTILSLPMLRGRFLAGPWSDQYAHGYAYREWGASQWSATGHIPLWNPEIFGGMPYVGAMHGDIFYPTAWLRLVLPTDIAMNLGFFVHYILAGVFTYLLLRMIRASWTGAVVGGLAYQLSGVVASYVSPGHDGKLFVTALLPLGLIALVMALRDRRWEGYPLLALTVGLALLSPQFQMAYYFLIVAGLFALYLTFGLQPGRPLALQLRDLGLALGAVALGFGVAMIQILPFYEYLPYSPRAEGYYGYEGSVSFAIPWEHVPEFFLSHFVGSLSTYWGSNFLKLHSEYLGLPVVGLAVLGAATPGPRRKLVLWLGGIGILFLLISLGGSTPFYRVWWAVMPFVKQTRAPGMAFFVVAFVAALLAALGVDRLQAGEGKGVPKVWFAVAVAVAVLAAAGLLGALAESLARSAEAELGRPRVARALDARRAIQWGAFSSALALAALAGVVVLYSRGKLKGPTFAMLMALFVGGDLWWNANRFWNYSDAPRTIHRLDPITRYLAEQPRPFRVFMDPNAPVYPGALLMDHDIAEVFGHHGNELDAFDQLWGGKNIWRFRAHPKLWDLYAVRYVVARTTGLVGYRTVLSNVETSTGVEAVLLEREEPTQYARLVPAAAKVVREEAVQTLLRRQFPVDRVVILDQDAAVDTPPLEALPEPLNVAVEVEDWAPGQMRLRITPGAPQNAYVLVGENYYPNWHATVDGEPAPLLRGDVALMAVPVQAGAQQVELRFSSGVYAVGKGITLGSLGVILITMILPPVMRKRGA